MALPCCMHPCEQGVKKTLAGFPARGRIIAVGVQPRFDKRPHQPRPYGALVVAAIALPDSTLIMTDVAGLFGRKGTKSGGSQKMCLH